MQYECKGCNAGGCKLWREVNTNRSAQLLCLACVSKIFGEDFTRVEFKPGANNWTFGSWIPAVRITNPELREDDDNMFWGYSEEKVSAYHDWMAWYALPTRATKSISAIWISGRV